MLLLSQLMQLTYRFKFSQVYSKLYGNWTSRLEMPLVLIPNATAYIYIYIYWRGSGMTAPTTASANGLKDGMATSKDGKELFNVQATEA
jgi:hypothetical protein